MTPDKARDLLDGTTPGPWEPHPDYPTMLVNLHQKMAVAAIPGKPEDSTPEDEANLSLIAAAPDMARTIAGMRPQYRAEYRLADGTWAMYDGEKCDGWTTVHGFARGLAAELARTGAAVRVVRRYVTEPEEA